MKNFQKSCNICLRIGCYHNLFYDILSSNSAQFKLQSLEVLILKKKIKKIHKNGPVVLATKSIDARPFYVAVLALWSIYAYLTLTSPNTVNQYHLSQQTIHIIRISFAIPYLLIWLSAAYSYVKIKRYAVAISPSSESLAFKKIGTVVLLLLSSLVISTYASTARNIMAEIPQMRPILTILTNYAYVFPYLFAFVLLYRSTKEFGQQQANIKFTVRNCVVYGIPLVLLAYAWLELIFTNPYRVVPGSASKFASYYLKDSLLILTVVIPLFISWFIGLLSVIKLKIYHQKVAGKIYRNALSSLVNGLIGVIAASVFLQALLSLGPQRLLDLGLEKLLGFVYLFLIIQALGFYFIAKGANNLTKIESV